MSKTPVSRLQELAVAKLEGSPQYTFLYSNGGFKCRVECFGTEAEGDGVNKKAAKHRAASNLLKNLKFDENHNVESVSPKVEGFNYVGKLQEYCLTNKLNLPNYEVVEETVIEPARKFTLKCTLGSFSTEGTGRSKKLAKHKAAMCMWNLLNNCNNSDTYEKKNSLVGNILSMIDSKEVAPISPHDDAAMCLGNKLKDCNDSVTFEKKYSLGRNISSTNDSKEVAPISPHEDAAMCMRNKLKDCNDCDSVKHISLTNNKELTPISPYNELCEKCVPKNVFGNNQREEMSGEVESKDDFRQEDEMSDLYLANFNKKLVLTICGQAKDSHPLDSDDE